MIGMAGDEQLPTSLVINIPTPPATAVIPLLDPNDFPLFCINIPLTTVGKFGSLESNIGLNHVYHNDLVYLHLYRFLGMWHLRCIIREPGSTAAAKFVLSLRADRAQIVIITIIISFCVYTLGCTSIAQTSSLFFTHSTLATTYLNTRNVGHTPPSQRAR